MKSVKFARMGPKNSFHQPIFPTTRLPSRTFRSDAGDTLIEILITVTILSLTAVSLLGAFASDLSGAAVYKNTSTIETVLKNFAEDAIYEIQYQTNPSPQYPLFTACAHLGGVATSTISTSTMMYGGTKLSYVTPSGYTVSVISSANQYFNQSSGTFSGTCDSTQSEPQYFTETVTGPPGTTATGTLSFVVASSKYVQPS